MKIGFVSWFANGLFDDGSPTPFGGAEIRCVQFACALAARAEHEVTLIVGEEGRPPIGRRGDLDVLAVPVPDRTPSLHQEAHQRFFANISRSRSFLGWRLKRLHPDLLQQLPVLLAAQLPVLRRYVDLPRSEPVELLDRLDLDVVCCFQVSRLSASVVITCRRRNLPIVLFLVHDDDLRESYTRYSTYRDPYHDFAHLCYESLTGATSIVAQTEYQQSLLLERFGLSCRVIRNPVSLSNAPPAGRNDSEPRVIWIGRAETAYKRPELCLELARRLPERRFLMVARPQEPDLLRRLRSAAPPNLEIVERLSPADAEAAIASSAAVINTSSREGFPNVFLQAAKYSVPIVSLEVDPDGFLSRCGCGLVAGGDLDIMAAQLDRVCSDAAFARKLGKAARRHAAEHHDLEGRADELEDLLVELVTAQTGTRRRRA